MAAIRSELPNVVALDLDAIGDPAAEHLAAQLLWEVEAGGAEDLIVPGVAQTACMTNPAEEPQLAAPADADPLRFADLARREQTRRC